MFKPNKAECNGGSALERSDTKLRMDLNQPRFRNRYFRFFFFFFFFFGSNCSTLTCLKGCTFKVGFINTVELQWLKHRLLVYHGLFELIFASLRIFSDSSRKKKVSREFFLFCCEFVCCMYSLESSH